MTDTPGEQLDPEPQSERGAPGSRDTGSDEASGGPVDRSAGTADAESDTSVDPQESDDEAPNLQTP
ncbi:MAG: hypothetical protein QOE97_3409 [Pseudonocardiales bacterium]|jgi:hypothetical protein|nr:hypothetical protein [Pseudonocardiales bacterium]